MKSSRHVHTWGAHILLDDRRDQLLAHFSYKTDISRIPTKNDNNTAFCYINMHAYAHNMKQSETTPSC